MEFIFLEDVMTQNNNFKIVFFPYNAFIILQSLTSLKITKKINTNLRKVFKNFLTFYDLEICTKVIYKTWARILPTKIESLWIEKLLKSDSRTEGNANSSFLAKANVKSN